MQELISVVVPVYNVEKYLERCVRSILEQTYQNLEVILVNDGSTDQSGKICDALAAQDQRIRVVHKENGGLSDARNAGIQQAKGSYISFFDSDDWVEAHIIETGIRELQKNRLDVVIWGYFADFVDEHERLLKQNTSVLSGICECGVDNSILTKWPALGLYGYAWNKIYRTKMLKENHLQFQKGLSLVEDILFNSQVTQHCKRIGFIDSIGNHYIQRKRETLGNRYYPDMFELKMLGCQARESILRHFGICGSLMEQTMEVYYMGALKATVAMIAKRKGESAKKRQKQMYEWLVKKEVQDLVGRISGKQIKDRIFVVLIRMKASKPLVRFADDSNQKCIMGLGMLVKKIKRFIPEKVKRAIGMLFVSDHDSHWLQMIDKDRENIYVFLGGFYQNLGDMAITYAQIHFLQQMYRDANLVVIPSTKTYQAIKTLKKRIKPDELITLIGGGNMADIYTSLEDARLHVVRTFPENRILSFPQTIDFALTPHGRKRKEISRRVYAAHKNLTIFAREPHSLERARRDFTDIDIGFCPDIVLSLDKVQPKCERTDVICCMRSDKEQQTSEDMKNALAEGMQNAFGNVRFVDTVDVTLEECKPENYEQTLENFWSMLRKCRVVVTDRLHCMIFCAITGTPCVVLDNTNHKISGVYDAWLTEIPYITMLREYRTEDVIAEARKLYEETFDVEHFCIMDQYEQLKEKCR